MPSRRWLAWLLLAVTALAVACGGDDGETGQPDAAPADAAGGITTESGVVGEIHLYDDALGDAVLAEFRSGATIVRVADSPECVIWLERPGTILEGAGTLTVGGSIVGSAGGPASVLTPGVDNGQYVYFGPVFAAGEPVSAEVTLGGGGSFPAMPPQTVSAPPASAVAVSEPAPPPKPDPGLPPGGRVAAASSQPLELAWTRPAEWDQSDQLFVRLSSVCGPTCELVAAVHCAFPATAESARIRPSVLTYLVDQLGTPAVGSFALAAGRYVEHATEGASYVIEMVQPGASTAPMLYGVGIEIE